MSAQDSQADGPPIVFTEWLKLPAQQRGYCSYMYSAWPNSNIPEANPYVTDTPDWHAFNQGAFQAMLEAQDSEG